MTLTPRLQRLLRLTLPALALSACAEYPDAQHPRLDGWRVATVDHTVKLDESTPLVGFTQDCRALLHTASEPPSSWVMLHYRRPPEDIFRVVPVADPSQLKQGDSVYVQVQSCDRALERR